METLSDADRLILEAYTNLVDALAVYLGEAFEIVLHSLEDFDHSVITIRNGVHSGRKKGAPITDVALSMLEKFNSGDPAIAESGHAVYRSASKYGKPVKSTTIFVRGTAGRVIGLLCINFYLDSPISSLLQNFSLNDPAQFIDENFINDSDELIKRALEKVKASVFADESVSASQKNKVVVTQLYCQGIFKLKNAVPLISQELGLSKNTVYMHIRTLEESVSRS